MFTISKDKELSIELLYKMISKFNMEVKPKLSKYKKYYDGAQAILNKQYSDQTKPCNRTVINYCKNIVDCYCGYLATPNYISYFSDQDINQIMDILRYNDYQCEDSDFLLSALIYGVGAELMYIDDQAKTRFRLINPETCFGIYDDTLTGDLLYFVRMYKQDEWDNSNKWCVDVYDDYTIKHYTMNGYNGAITFTDEENHYFNQCPANIFYLPDERSIFDCIISIQDSYNELLSAEIDDYQAFCDAYLALEDMDADYEDIQKMKEARVLLLPAGGKAYWITKQSNDAQIKNMLDDLHKAIYREASCPDFSSESFVGGVSSGIAIQYRLTGMETRAGKIEGLMRKALQRRIEIICGIASLKLGEEIFRDIQIDFKRNIPIDVNVSVDLVNKLKGSVSDATLLAQLPFITDVNSELDRINEQKEEEIKIYGFNTSETDEEGKEE